MNEHEITALLERAGEDLAPDVDRITAAGLARGRRKLRRRRAGTALAVAAVVGVGVGGAWGVTVAGGTGPDQGVEVASQSPSPDGHGIDTDDDGKDDAWVTASVRPVDKIHPEVRRILGDDAGPLLRGSYGPLKQGKHDVSWFFRYDGTLTQINVIAESGTCEGYGEVFVDPPECESHDGIPIAVHDAYEADLESAELCRPVEAWQHGYVVRIITCNSDERGPAHESTIVTDQPPIPVEDMVDLVTSGIWFAE